MFYFKQSKYYTCEHNFLLLCANFLTDTREVLNSIVLSTYISYYKTIQ